MTTSENPPPQLHEDGSPPQMQSEVQRLLAITGEPPHDIRFDVPVSAQERTRVDGLWMSAGLSAAGSPIALGPGSKMPAKRWPVDRFIELGRLLVSVNSSVRLIVIGGPDDKAIGDAIANGVGEGVVNWAGRLTVLESAEALRRCAAFVGNDSGAMHLAAAMDVPCVAVFSARDYPGRWDPHGDGHTVLRKNVPCACCQLSVCHDRSMLCLTLITVDEVFAACQSRRRAGTGSEDHRVNSRTVVP